MNKSVQSCSSTKETLLSAEEGRTNIFPIRYPKVWSWYKKALSSFWVAGEVDLSRDAADWKTLTDGERHFLSRVLGFFASADGIVNDNLAERFGVEVTIREVKFFYDLQKTMENIHSEMYSLLLDTVITDAAEKDTLLHASSTVPCVQRKAEWARKWIDSSDSFPTRLVAFAVVEGIFFSGSFCAIFWMKKRGLMPGLCVSNSLIARDEGMHQQFATFLYSEMVREKLPTSVLHEIVGDAVEHEISFCTDALPVSLIGMNADDMSTYIRYVADRLLSELGAPALYGVSNPFEWMELISLESKSNFFEHRVSEYQKAGASSESSKHTFSTEAEF